MSEYGCHDCGEERAPRRVAGKLTCPECGSENIVCIGGQPLPAQAASDTAQAGVEKQLAHVYEKCGQCHGDGCQFCTVIGVVVTGVTSGQLKRLAELDLLRQESGITAAMLRGGRARNAVNYHAKLLGVCEMVDRAYASPPATLHRNMEEAMIILREMLAQLGAA